MDQSNPSISSDDLYARSGSDRSSHVLRNGQVMAARQPRRFYVFIALACVLYIAIAESASCVTATIDGQKADVPPAAFDLDPLGESARARWHVVQDATAAAGFAIEQMRAPTNADSALAISKAASLRNVDVSLRLKAISGFEDQAGGVALRLVAPDTYYLVQVDVRRDRVLFQRVTGGVSEDIVGVDADIASDAWHTLNVRAMEDEFVITLDGVWMFTAFDKSLSQGGHFALWTNVHGITRFESISIAPLRSSEHRW